jgi:aminoglycoside phosphotransferase (APT) family kinase protein
MSSVAGAPASVAARFALKGPLLGAEPFGGGHINDSWKLHTAGGGSYLLQRINHHVFPHPLEVMENVERVTRFLAGALQREGAADAARRVLTLVPTHAGPACHVDEGGSVWRVFVFLEGTVARLQPENANQAFSAARAFGTFQRRLARLPGPRLHETIPGFHDTPKRLAAFERTVEEDPYNRCREAGAEIERVLTNRDLAGALLRVHERGDIPERIVHNDAKMSNVLFDETTGEALCVVDLDTVMPGLALHDFGDMARSMSTVGAEDERDAHGLTVRNDLFEAVARGYLEGAQDIVGSLERSLLVTAARLITYEQAVRFLHDFLDGDRYYRTTRPLQNLDRCRAQMALLDAFTAAEPDLNRRIEHI